VYCALLRISDDEYKVQKPSNSRFKSFSHIYPEDSGFKYQTEKILSMRNVTEKLNVWDHRN
jgi:hypothetical protein